MNCQRATYFPALPGHEDVLVAEPGVVQAAQRFSLEKPKRLEITLNQFAHLKHILTHNTDNVTVLGMGSVKLNAVIVFRDLWIEADGAHRAS